MDNAPGRLTALATRLPFFILGDILQFVRRLKHGCFRVTHTRPPRNSRRIDRSADRWQRQPDAIGPCRDPVLAGSADDA